MSRMKEGVGVGLFVQCLYALSLHLVSVVFGTAIPTSLYILENVIYLQIVTQPLLKKVTRAKYIPL